VLAAISTRPWEVQRNAVHCRTSSFTRGVAHPNRVLAGGRGDEPALQAETLQQPRLLRHGQLCLRAHAAWLDVSTHGRILHALEAPVRVSCRAAHSAEVPERYARIITQLELAASIGPLGLFQAGHCHAGAVKVTSKYPCVRYAHVYASERHSVALACMQRRHSTKPTCSWKSTCAGVKVQAADMPASPASA